MNAYPVGRLDLGLTGITTLFLHIDVSLNTTHIRDIDIHGEFGEEVLQFLFFGLKGKVPDVQTTPFFCGGRSVIRSLLRLFSLGSSVAVGGFVARGRSRLIDGGVFGSRHLVGYMKGDVSQ